MRKIKYATYCNSTVSNLEKKWSILLNRVLENLSTVLLPGLYFLRDKAKIFPFNVLKYLKILYKLTSVI